MSIPTLRQRLEDFDRVLDDALFAIEGGKVTSMGAMDQIVAALCKDIEKAPPPEARDLQPLVARMITKLGEMEIRLTEFQRQLKKEQ